LLQEKELTPTSGWDHQKTAGLKGAGKEEKASKKGGTSAEKRKGKGTQRRQGKRGGVNSQPMRDENV